MNKYLQSALLALCALIVAACGGYSTPPTSMQGGSSHSSSAQLTNASYYDVVQHIYVAYFGRPADPAGMEFFAGAYLAAGAPTTVLGVSQAYTTNTSVRTLVEGFGVSQESLDLYPGDNTTFVNAIYRNLFNRDADAAGRDFWVNAINVGALTRANTALTIMAGAQGTDADLITKKNTVATAFTASVNTADRKKAYDGLAANVIVRTMLASVTLVTDTTAFQANIEATLNQLVAALPQTVDLYPQVASIVKARCAGCHSAHPTIAGFNPAPAGIMFDTSAQIHTNATLINQAAVLEQSMPFGNITNMTQAERDIIGQWFQAGAK